jgi:hypothetical protein
MGPPPAIELARDPLSVARDSASSTQPRSGREPSPVLRADDRAQRTSPPRSAERQLSVDDLSRDEVRKLADRVLTEMDKRRSLRADRGALK